MAGKRENIRIEPDIIKGMVVAAPFSGCGKTTLTMGLIAALKEQGLCVQAFKVGPDYIDTAYHSSISGRTAVNLDTWMTDDDFVRDTFRRNCHGADIAIVEGVMGLFDGGADGRGSTAHVAKILDLPVILIVDARACSGSAAAIVFGFEQFDPALKIAGVIFNNIASPGHFAAIKSAIDSRCSSKVLGYIPKDPKVRLPERQLGLVSIHETGLPDDSLHILASAIEKNIDLSGMLDLCADIRTGGIEAGREMNRIVRVGVARDAAFCFYYEDNLRLLRESGAEIVEFSPLEDSELPEYLDGLYFGGGFPEEFAGRLSDNVKMIESIREFTGPVIAECGGLIYLCREFISLGGESYTMVGKVPGVIEMTDSLQACGHREIVFNTDTVLGPAGSRIRGHEFHWSRWHELPGKNYDAFRTNNTDMGYSNGNVFASYFHFHFGSNPSAAKHFIDSCIGAKTEAGRKG